MGIIANQFKTVILLGILTGLMLGVGAFIGGQGGLTIALIIVLFFNFITYFFSDKIVLFMYGAKQVTPKQQPELHKIVEEVCKAADTPKPKIYIVPSETSNAFATGRSPKHAAVACTNGIMKILTREELKGVIAHEISHVKNRDILIATIAATIAGVISYLSRWALFFGGGDKDNRGNFIYLLILAILTPIIAILIQLAISRSREYLADESGARTIHNSHALASALSKLEAETKRNPMRRGNEATASLFIVNPFSAKGIVTLFSTHPSVDERVRRLKAIKF